MKYCVIIFAMKIALISDLHFGVKKSSPLLLEKFLKHQVEFFAKSFIPKLQSSNVEKIFILGDFFDCPDTTNVLVKDTTIKLMEKLLKELPNVTIHMLSGNHEIYYKNTLEINALSMFKHFDPRIEVITQITQIDLNGCKTLLVPWLIKESFNYNKFTEIIQKCKKSNKKYFDLCLGHFEINGFEMVAGVVEDKGINQSEFDVFGSVYSGHFHLRRTYGNIQYLGCPYEITSNDYGDIKGFTIFDTISKTGEFVENTVSPKHKQVKLSELLENSDLINELGNNFIKLKIDKIIDPNELLKIENKIKEFSLKYDSIDETSGGLEEINSEDMVENIQGNALLFLNEYIDNLSLPEHLSKDDFKLYVNKLYNLVENEE